ncbi:MAG: ABC transporter substrate-binding protein [Melioribacteraceae bacterium]|nr:ABC transporter substrate-binding protein [Melioribacteraceae bacterium]
MAKRTFNILIYAIIIVFNFASLKAQSEDSVPLEKIKLQLKWRHQFQFAGYYAALEKGFYKDAGLDVEILPSGPGANELQELLKGNVQYIISNSEAVVNYLNGKPIVVLGAIFQHSPAIFLSKKESGITTVQDLFGKRIMIQSNIESAELIATMKSEGIDLGEFTAVPMTYGLDGLLAGTVDAIHAYATDKPYELSKLGIEYNIIYPHKYSVDFYGDCLVTTKDEVENNSERAEKFRDASFKGWQYAMKHVDEIIDLILNKYNAKLDADVLKFEAEAMRSLIFPDLIEIGMINPGRWETIAQTYVDLGFAEKKQNLDDFIYKNRSFLDEWLEIIIIAVVAGLVLFIFTLLWVIQLRKMVNSRTKELQESEKKYRTVIENASDGIFIHQNGVLVLVNKSACEMAGYKIDELIGKSIFDLLEKDEIAKIEENYKRRLAGENISQIYITRIARKNGEFFEAEINSTVITFEGNLAILVIIRDVTQRKEIEYNLIKAKEKAEYSEKLKTDFLAQMSHEIRTPINTIFNFLSLIKEEVFNKVSDDVQQCFYLMNGAGKRIIRTIDLILNMSQFQEGTYEAKFSKFDLYEKVLHNLFLEYKKLSNEKGLQFLFNNDISNYQIFADEYTIGQIFQNLVDNAVKYTESGKIEITVNRDGDFLVVEISDTGIGIANEYLPNLFDSFSQEEKGYTRKYEGNGLGLALVKSYCDLNKAEISVKSEKNVGTSFTVKFNQGFKLENFDKLN